MIDTSAEQHQRQCRSVAGSEDEHDLQDERGNPSVVSLFTCICCMLSSLQGVESRQLGQIQRMFRLFERRGAQYQFIRGHALSLSPGPPLENVCIFRDHRNTLFDRLACPHARLRHDASRRVWASDQEPISLHGIELHVLDLAPHPPPPCHPPPPSSTPSPTSMSLCASPSGCAAHRSPRPRPSRVRCALRRTQSRAGTS